MSVTSKHAPWRLWILVIFWIVQFLFLILTIVSTIYSITQSNDSKVRTAIGICLIAITSVLTIVETVQCGKLNLKPAFYLISNVVKCSIWIGICTLGMIATARSQTVQYKSLTIALYFPMMLLFLLPVIYGGVVYHDDKRAARVRKLEADTMYATGSAFGTEAHGHHQYDLGVEYDAATSAITPRTHQYDKEIELKHYPAV